MVDFSKIEGFDWDEGNLDKNKIGHHVESYESEEVFFDKALIIKRDFKHSLREKRIIAIGMTREGRPLFIVFTLRKNLIRIISARDMNKKERKIYEEEERKKN